MKILIQGIKPADRWYQGTCKHCETVIEFQQREGILEYNDDDLGEYQYISIVCPTCNSKIQKNAADFTNNPS